MFPWVYGFTWDAGNFIFLGIFFTVAAVIAGTLTLASVRAYKDHLLKKHETIRWLGEFHDLPERARTCRHVYSGELQQRVCPNGFDCRICGQHEIMLRRQEVQKEPSRGNSVAPLRRGNGFQMPLDRLYHRGHTWVRMEADGTATIGLNDFSARLFGEPQRVDLPPVGAHLVLNGQGWRMYKNSSAVRVLSPVEGRVIEPGSPAQGWYVKVRPLGAAIDTRHLLHGEEVHPWIMAEMERLRAWFHHAGISPTLADGGEPVADFLKSVPDADWDGIWGGMFLEP